jgi:hypothetical protein
MSLRLRPSLTTWRSGSPLSPGSGGRYPWEQRVPRGDTTGGYNRGYNGGPTGVLERNQTRLSIPLEAGLQLRLAVATRGLVAGDRLLPSSSQGGTKSELVDSLDELIRRIANINALRRRSPHSWPRSRGITSQTRTPGRLRSRRHSHVLPPMRSLNRPFCRRGECRRILLDELLHAQRPLPR